jgi:hypothetical protein
LPGGASALLWGAAEIGLGSTFDVNITATNPFDDPKEFNIFIYRTGTVELPPAHIGGIIQKIKQLADIDGIIIAEIKTGK